RSPSRSPACSAVMKSSYQRLPSSWACARKRFTSAKISAVPFCSRRSHLGSRPRPSRGVGVDRLVAIVLKGAPLFAARKSLRLLLSDTDEHHLVAHAPLTTPALSHLVLT